MLGQLEGMEGEGDYRIRAMGDGLTNDVFKTFKLAENERPSGPS